MLIISRGIGIRAERQPVAFEQFDHLAFGHMGAAVERHVFDVMRKAALIVVFVQRARIDLHPHQRGAFGLGIAADYVMQAIGQHAEPVTGIDRDVAALECPGGLGRTRTGHMAGAGCASSQREGGNR